VRGTIILLTALIIIAISLTIGVAFGILLIIPSYIALLIVFVRIKLYWKKRGVFN